MEKLSRVSPDREVERLGTAGLVDKSIGSLI